MQIETKMPVFADLSNYLMEAEAIANPAEVHGVLTGLICAGQRLDGQFWFDSVLRVLKVRASLSLDQRSAIIDLYDTICRQLSCADAEFILLLTVEERPLKEKTMALSHWCEGFLYGLGLGGATPVGIGTPDEIIDALHCMVELAHLEFEKIEVNELNVEMERLTYRRTLDYIRTAVIAMYEAFAKKPKYLH